MTTSVVTARPRLWRIPATDLLEIAGVVGFGAFAAYRTEPALWVVTPIVAGVLLINAVRGARRRQRASSVDGPSAPLPSRIERFIADVFAMLPPGEVRELLDDVVQRARALLEALAGQPDERRLTRDVTDLVEACCEIAREHARLDAVLPALWEPALAPAAARGSADDAGADELRRRGEAGRALLTRRLHEAVAAMDEMLVQRGVERSGSAAERVAELTSELAAEAAARRHAAQEIQRLMQGRG